LVQLLEVLHSLGLLFDWNAFGFRSYEQKALGFFDFYALRAFQLDSFVDMDTWTHADIEKCGSGSPREECKSRARDFHILADILADIDMDSTEYVADWNQLVERFRDYAKSLTWTARPDYRLWIAEFINFDFEEIGDHLRRWRDANREGSDILGVVRSALYLKISQIDPGQSMDAVWNDLSGELIFSALEDATKFDDRVSLIGTLFRGFQAVAKGRDPIKFGIWLLQTTGSWRNNDRCSLWEAEMIEAIQDPEVSDKPMSFFWAVCPEQFARDQRPILLEKIFLRYVKNNLDDLANLWRLIPFAHIGKDVHARFEVLELLGLLLRHADVAPELARARLEDIGDFCELHSAEIERGLKGHPEFMPLYLVCGNERSEDRMCALFRRWDYYHMDFEAFSASGWNDFLDKARTFEDQECQRIIFGALAGAIHKAWLGAHAGGGLHAFAQKILGLNHFCQPEFFERHALWQIDRRSGISRLAFQIWMCGNPPPGPVCVYLSAELPISNKPQEYKDQGFPVSVFGEDFRAAGFIALVDRVAEACKQQLVTYIVRNLQNAVAQFSPLTFNQVKSAMMLDTEVQALCQFQRGYLVDGSHFLAIDTITELCPGIVLSAALLKSVANSLMPAAARSTLIVRKGHEFEDSLVVLTNKYTEIRTWQRVVVVEGDQKTEMPVEDWIRRLAEIALGGALFTLRDGGIIFNEAQPEKLFHAFGRLMAYSVHRIAPLGIDIPLSFFRELMDEVPASLPINLMKEIKEGFNVFYSLTRFKDAITGGNMRTLITGLEL
jgi:hypothetical protein